MNNNMVLLKTLLLSTSRRNTYKYSKDRKKRRRAIANMVGTIILYAMLIVFSIAMCIGYGEYGMISSVPVLCALTVSAIAFLFTLFKTNGYLFNFKEYDMLMSLPFEARTVAGCKFLYMYIQSLPWYISISLAMMIGYGIYAHPFIVIYLLWIVLSLFLPVIPMLAAAFFGFLIARISAGFKKTNLIQTVLTMLFVLFCFFVRFMVEDLVESDQIQATLETASVMTDKAAGIYLPAGWFANAVTNMRISDSLLLIGLSILLFSAVFYIVGRSYRSINSALKSHAAARSYRMSAQKQHSAVRAIAFKEFKRLTGSTTYMVNGGIGVILASIIGLLTLIIGPEKILSALTHGAPIDSAMLRPAIPFIVYFFIGMMATTACSPSLEGKNYWILQSLPIRKKTIYQGKMLFNMILTVPFMAFSTLCMCIASRTPVLETILYLLLGLALCSFSTAWGCVCGVRHMRLDWENEVEVIKQGAAVTIYLLPNMFAVMALTVLAVFLGFIMNRCLLALLFTLVAGLLAGLSYWWVMVLARDSGPRKSREGRM